MFCRVHINHQDGEKWDFSDFNRGMTVCARRVGLSVSVPSVPADFHTQQSLEFTQAEKHLRMHNMSNLEADGLQQQKTTSGFNFCQPRTES